MHEDRLPWYALNRPIAHAYIISKIRSGQMLPLEQTRYLILNTGQGQCRQIVFDERVLKSKNAFYVDRCAARFVINCPAPLQQSYIMSPRRCCCCCWWSQISGKPQKYSIFINQIPACRLTSSQQTIRQLQQPQTMQQNSSTGWPKKVRHYQESSLIRIKNRQWD